MLAKDYWSLFLFFFFNLIKSNFFLFYTQICKSSSWMRINFFKFIFKHLFLSSALLKYCEFGIDLELKIGKGFTFLSIIGSVLLDNPWLVIQLFAGLSRYKLFLIGSNGIWIGLSDISEKIKKNQDK